MTSQISMTSQIRINITCDPNHFIASSSIDGKTIIDIQVSRGFADLGEVLETLRHYTALAMNRSELSKNA